MKTTSVMVVPMVVLACSCNLVSRNEQEPAPAPAPVFTVAPPTSGVAEAVPSAPQKTENVAVADLAASGPTALADYAQEGLGTLPDNCVAPAVVMMAVPTDYYANDSFDWRHVRQVALANPEFKIVPSLAGAGALGISFAENEHKPTKGVALVAHCSTSKTCLRFAAAYRTVVPTAKVTPICGANPNIGSRITGGKTVLPQSGDIKGVLPDKKDVQSQCVRLAACKAARDYKLSSDETQACMMKPSTFKISCALKKTCEQVLSCSGS